LKQNAVARLKEVSPGMEVWWDSSPLVYEEWRQGPGREFADEGLFVRGAASDFAATSLLDGATTNQPLTLQVLEKYPAEWSAWVAQCCAGADRREAMWRAHIEVAARGADMLAPIFEATGRRMGQICCQVDPRDMADVAAMVAQARRIHAARPNIMVKMPGTKEGIEGVRILTAEGIPTNVTLGFTVAQLVAVGEAAQAGLAEAQRRGADLRNWRSCAVMMLGRYEDHPVFREQAAARGIELTDADLRWAGIAIFREAHRLFKQRGYPSKLMAASMRLGPTVEGAARVWHLEQLAGADAVLTVFPNIFEAFIRAYRDLPLRSVIDEPIPPETLEKLTRIPYFVEAYAERGIAPEDFAAHPALQATAASFTEAMEKVEAFAAGDRAVA
jgi:transaldolase